ncbi:MAG: alanine racemase [Clostridia bacterium]|nr:alanine racemase [Clostridia bacterium]
MLKYRRVYAEVDLGAIRHNLIKIKERVGKKLLVVIKANAYGHGALKVAKATCDIADYFAVATIEEAIQLREADIKNPILILGYVSPEYFGDLVKYDIEQTLFDLESAQLLAKAGGKAHIAIDTGMGRIGFAPNEESIETIKKIALLDGIKLEGIFTHFSTADEKDKSFSNEQFALFTGFVKRLEEEGVNIPLKHVANSATIVDMPDMSLDLVRSGIITYGLKPSGDVGDMDIKPALKLKTHVVYVKKVLAGTPISYGRTYVTDSERIIATIPVGYADGYPRALSNCGRVTINGYYAPIVGRVCMDQFMVDVTDIPDVKVGDTVGLIDEMIPCEEIARIEGTINYETVCKISDRVPRIYINE